jgi:hypothetical protein
MQSSEIEINSSSGPIPFDIFQKKFNEDGSIKEIKSLTAKDLYEIDREAFLYYYDLTALMLHSMADSITDRSTDMIEVQRNYHKIAKLAKNFVELKGILKANNDSGE